MATTDDTAQQEWARALCQKWNWNADIAEIAQALIALGVHPAGSKFAVLKDVFNEFFNHPKMDVIEAVEQVMQTFGDFDLGADE